MDNFHNSRKMFMAILVINFSHFILVLDFGDGNFKRAL